MMAGTKRQVRAKLLRDLVVNVVSAFGERSKSGSGLPYLLASVGDLEVGSVRFGQGLCELDVWAPHNGKHTKVLNLHCGDDGSISVVSYKRGSWEECLAQLAVAATAVTQIGAVVLQK